MGDKRVSILAHRDTKSFKLGCRRAEIIQELRFKHFNIRDDLSPRVLIARSSEQFAPFKYTGIDIITADSYPKISVIRSRAPDGSVLAARSIVAEISSEIGAKQHNTPQSLSARERRPDIVGLIAHRPQ